jgi:hypothetical protein
LLYDCCCRLLPACASPATCFAAAAAAVPHPLKHSVADVALLLLLLLGDWRLL